MTALPVTVHPDTDLAEAAQLMTESTVKSPPVVEDSRLVGIVSRTDVVRMLALRDERVEADIDDLIRSEGMDWLVEVEDGVGGAGGGGTPIGCEVGMGTRLHGAGSRGCAVPHVRSPILRTRARGLVVGRARQESTLAERDRTAPALTPVRFVAPLNLRFPPLQFPQLQ